MTERTPATKISAPKKLVYALVVTIMGLILLEIILRLAGLFPAERLFEKKNASVSWQENLFANFMGIHQPDPEFLWKMKPNLIKSFMKTNSRGLTGQTVPYEKDTSKLRILVLGDSTPLGIGLKDWNDSFVWHLLRGLRTDITSGMDREIEMINASTAGYTSLQGLKYYQIEGRKYKPDLVLVYLGNNDASYNGYLSDSSLMAGAEQFIGLKKTLNNFKLYRLLKSVLIPLKSDLASHQDQELKIRVSPESFRLNLLKLADLCRDDGAKLMLCTIPVPLNWPPGVEFKVFTSGRDSVSGQLYMPEQQREMLTKKSALAIDWKMFERDYGSIDPWSLKVLKSAYADTGDIESIIKNYHDLIGENGDDPQYANNLGVLFWRNHDYDSALVYLRRAHDKLTDDPVLLYNLGMTFYGIGDEDSADHYLRLARDLDYNSLRIKTEYNDIIREVAERDGIWMSDLVLDFEREDMRDHFVDHCHPDLRGHKFVADMLANKIESIFYIENK